MEGDLDELHEPLAQRKVLASGELVGLRSRSAFNAAPGWHCEYSPPGTPIRSDASRRIFNTEELANLKSILRLNRTEGIDRLAAGKATIEVTINPEARISISRTGVQLLPFTCGVAEPLTVRIVKLDLSGASLEYRLLMLKLNSLQPIDLSIVMDAGPGTNNLSLRSQTHPNSYTSCRQVRQAGNFLGSFM